MKKIAFLVEEDFYSRHFGVRNFFSTIKRCLEEEYFVDYIICTFCHEGNLWYRVVANDEGTEIKTEKIELEGKLINNFNFTSFSKSNKNKEIKQINSMYSFQYLGRDLKAENYDICIITNPWLLEMHMDIQAKEIYGIVHDFVPNIYSLTNRTGNDFFFANQHHSGYMFFNSVCSKILCNSEKTQQDYKIFFPNLKHIKIECLPPYPPYEFKTAQFIANDKKENAVVLAAPFDLRKGLRNIPDLINSSSKAIETLYVFGQPRCAENDFNEFFKSLKVSKLVYYPKISYEDLIALYKKCKVLLFPSLEEGLGIPIIEAQVCGCRVITTNASPMKDLLLNGSTVLRGGEEDNMLVGKMIGEEFDYAGLSKSAWKKFSYKNMLEKLFEGGEI